MNGKLKVVILIINSSLIKYKAARKKIRQEFRKAKAIFELEAESEIEKCNEIDQKQFWYFLKKKRRDKLPESLRKSSSETTSDPNEIKGMWYDHFKKLSQTPIGVDSDCEAIDDVNKVFYNIDNDSKEDLIY